MGTKFLGSRAKYNIIEDAGAYFTADKVEGALQEIGATLGTLSGALVYRGTYCDGGSGNYPAAPVTGDYYVSSCIQTLTDAGGPQTYQINDAMIYNGVTWDKIDNAIDISLDVTPTLGGNLDVNGFYISAPSGQVISLRNIAAEIAQVHAGGLTLASAKIYNSADEDNAHYFGRAAVGSVTGSTDQAFFGHRDMFGALANHGFMQTALGLSVVNSTSDIYLTVLQTPIMRWNNASNVYEWYSKRMTGIADPSAAQDAVNLQYFQAQAAAVINTVGLSLATGKVYSSFDEDSVHYFGRAGIGFATGGLSDWAYFGHRDKLGAADEFAVGQDSTGITILNSVQALELQSYKGAYIWAFGNLGNLTWPSYNAAGSIIGNKTGNAGIFQLIGGASAASSPWLKFYSPAHATLASDILFGSAAVDLLQWDQSADRWIFSKVIAMAAGQQIIAAGGSAYGIIWTNIGVGSDPILWSNSSSQVLDLTGTLRPSGGITLGSAGVGNNAPVLTFASGSDGTATFGGSISIPDNKYLLIGAGNDLQLYHNGSQSYINNITGNLEFNSPTFVFDLGGVFYIRDSDDANITLFQLNTSARTLQIGGSTDAVATSHWGTLAMNTNKITGLGDPAAAQDAVTRNHLDTVYDPVAKVEAAGLQFDATKTLAFNVGAAVEVINTNYNADDVSLMTSLAIATKIEAYGYSTTVGTVTAVSAGAPILSSGGATPNITIPVATGIADGYLSSVDWQAFDDNATAAEALAYVNSQGLSLLTTKVYTSVEEDGTHAFGGLEVITSDHATDQLTHLRNRDVTTTYIELHYGGQINCVTASSFNVVAYSGFGAFAIYPESKGGTLGVLLGCTAVHTSGLEMRAYEQYADSECGLSAVFIAGESIAAYDCVYITSTDTEIGVCDITTAAKMPCIGIALEARSIGQIKIQTYGVMAKTGWTWTAGGAIYVGTGGALTQTAPSTSGDQLQIIGYAISATRIFLRPWMHMEVE